MKIIIAGCGKVGYTLAEQLSEEGHEITVIEPRAERVEAAVDALDIIGYIGNGNSYKMQKEAGVEDADLLIAVTGHDEVNLLSCLIAKKAGNCRTIARVRNPEYVDEIGFIKEELGLSVAINPELATARDIERLIQVPSALDVDTFAKGRAYMVRFEIPKGSPWPELRVMDAAVKYGNHFLVCILERGDDVVIPSGNTVMMEGDTISMISPTEDMNRLFNVIGIPARPIRNVMIAGGGTIAYYLAQRLLKTKVNTTIIESNLQRCNELSEKLDRATIIHGDAADSKLLLEEGLEQMDAFVALTNFDEENIMLSLYAHQVSKAKLITKINKIAFEGIVKSIPVGSIISPKYLTAEHITQYVRDLGNSMIDERDSKVEMVYWIADGKAEALEFSVEEHSKVTNVPLMDLKLKPNLLICSIMRANKVIIPSGQDCILSGDKVVVVATGTHLSRIEDILDGAVK
ncbi:MAG: Trk system potassium transporter TrkA [Frisingicoccus sp.]